MKLAWILPSLLIIGCSIGYGILGGMKEHIIVDRHSIETIELSPPRGDGSISIASKTEKTQTNSSQSRPQLKILLPLYIYPNWYDRDNYAWKQVITAAKKVPIVAIINPNNGPDNAPPNTDYQQGIKDLHQAGIEIVGYVPTNYARRNLQAVKTDIDIYAKHFKIDGIFIDEAAATRQHLDYYRQVYQYIKSRTRGSSRSKSQPYLAIANPGTNVDATLISQPIADIITIFENYQRAWKDYRPPAYAKYPDSYKFAVLIHTTADRQTMENSLDRVAEYQFGYVYITNDSIDSPDRNPWNSLPEYWQSQINYIHKLNAGR